MLAHHFLWRWACSLTAVLVAAAGLSARAAPPETLRVAFGEIEITPALGEGKKTVWMAGFGHGRAATGVHDPLMARTVVLDDGQRKIALVSVDLIGLQYSNVLRIRERLKKINYVMVSSTHNHEGPDVIGIWGRNPLVTGVDPAYLTLVEDRVVKVVEVATKQLAPAQAAYGTAEDEKLLGDSRLPKVYDGVLRVVTFRAAATDDKPAGGGRPLIGVLVQWNCHPEAMGSKNKLITADFPAATVGWLKDKYKVPVAYFSGAVGGLMAPPDGVIKDDQGKLLLEGDFAYSDAYGRAVGRLASQAIERAEPLQITPLAVYAKPVAVPLNNAIYRLARTLGVIERDGRRWTGDAEKLGEKVSQEPPDKKLAVETEVAYLRLGELHVACIPGEIYPELVYGKYQQPVDPGADYPEAPLEKAIMSSLPGKKVLLFGLANDEIGYIIPKRQWDQEAPFCYGRKKAQYGEINSVGPEAAPIITQALANRVREGNGR
jgi:hypothetical protein